MDIKIYKENSKTKFLAEDFRRLLREEDEIKKIIENDPSMKELSEDELKNITSQKEELKKQMDAILEGDKIDEEFPNEIILEIRAGAGGEEASLFAEELASMYKRYSENKNWQWFVIDESRSSSGGYKEGSFEIHGKGVYKMLRFETGVHRVQRVPATEKSGRVHTSTASVAILPIRKKYKVEIKESDLIIEFSRSGGAGADIWNKVETAVRMVHKPTGLEVRCTSERSQLKNREKAMSILMAKIQVLKDEEEAKKFASSRKEQIGTGDRSEKIRTYNFLQDRVTDHRIKESWHSIHLIMEGNIDEIIEAVVTRAEAGKLEKADEEGDE